MTRANISNGDDTLEGGNGRDSLDGGGGRDRLFGDSEADTFAFGRGDIASERIDWGDSQKRLLFLCEV